jgi:hypothetical protein
MSEFFHAVDAMPDDVFMAMILLALSFLRIVKNDA